MRFVEVILCEFGAPDLGDFQAVSWVLCVWLILYKDCLFYMKLWVTSPGVYKLSVVAQTCHPSTWEVEAGESGVQSYLLLHR